MRLLRPLSRRRSDGTADGIAAPDIKLHAEIARIDERQGALTLAAFVDHLQQKPHIHGRRLHEGIWLGVEVGA